MVLAAKNCWMINLFLQTFFIRVASITCDECGRMLYESVFRPKITNTSLLSFFSSFTCPFAMHTFCLMASRLANCLAYYYYLSFVFGMSEIVFVASISQDIKSPVYSCVLVHTDWIQWMTREQTPHKHRPLKTTSISYHKRIFMWCESQCKVRMLAFMCEGVRKRSFFESET